MLVVGSCSDNTRIIQVFASSPTRRASPLPEMPFAVSGPELANEKTMGQLMAVLAHGVTAVVGLTPNLPIPALGPAVEPSAPGAERNAITDFFDEGLPALTGARLVVEPDPVKAAEAAVATIGEARRRSAGTRSPPRWPASDGDPGAHEGWTAFRQSTLGLVEYSAFRLRQRQLLVRLPLRSGSGLVVLAPHEEGEPGTGEVAEHGDGVGQRVADRHEVAARDRSRPSTPG